MIEFFIQFLVSQACPKACHVPHAMPKSLLEQLPEIVANGRKQAERILESLETR